MIVPVLLPLRLWMRFGIIHTRERYLESFPFSVSRSDRVRTMDPAIRIQHVLRQILTVDTIDRIADVLPRSNDQRK